MRVAASHDSPNYPSYNHDIPPNMEETVLSGMQLPERAGPLALSSRSSSFMQKVLGKTSAKANTQIETLCQAGRAGDLPRAKRLVAAGANLNGHDRHDGYTPLGVAVQHNRVAVAKFFLENGANPDEGYKEKWKAKSTLSNKKHSLSPLHLAARSGYAKLVDLLVEHGADVHNASGCWHNHANFTPLQQSRKEATRSLLVHGASAVSQDGSGWFPLADAAFGCRLSCVKTLIEFGALVDQQTNEGQTPLFITCSRPATVESPQIIKCLIKAKASPEPQRWPGLKSRTALDIFDPLSMICQKRSLNSHDVESARILLRAGLRKDGLAVNQALGLLAFDLKFHGEARRRQIMEELLWARTDPSLAPSHLVSMATLSKYRSKSAIVALNLSPSSYLKIMIHTFSLP